MPARVAVGVMAWFGFINLYMTRVNLSVIIVAMVDKSSTSETFQFYCQNSTSNGEFDWNEIIQGVVLSSFGYGYTITQVLGGRLAERYGAKWVFGVSILSGGVANFLTPTAARLHYGVLIALRALQGLFQGIPIKCDLVVFLAIGLGTAVALPMCGMVIDAAGWPAAFYVTGICSLLWCVLWFSVIYSTPAQHPRISREELQYIENAVRSSGTSRNGPSRVPWKSMATSLPFWAINVIEMCNCYGISIIRAQLPTFMKNIFGLSIKMVIT
ncbi:hypothetical protein Pmani_002256 [Petrolisthes manimaculis]|uniref:Major facilitator superfamily (MFS) profile domain-containing protein n=1 Tax=Petrolisthes manimaculis TaxID=1843537 RepID=A0AAE1QIG4_9EUCA|nr:hypothetical protein Pmani_002256 [Petrolisthes manimaculis]